MDTITKEYSFNPGKVFFSSKDIKAVVHEDGMHVVGALTKQGLFQLTAEVIDGKWKNTKEIRTLPDGYVYLIFY